MKPGERVNVVRRIGALLGEWEWTDIDLVLRAFGFSWSPNWDGDRLSYVINHIEDGDDQILLQLLAYVENPAASGSVPSASDPWTSGHFRLFLSHISAEKVFLGEVKEGLDKWGVDGFVAHADITPSAEWMRVIERALATCDALAAFLHDGFRKSAWADQEVGFVIQRNILVIPIRFTTDDPHGFLSRYQAVTAVGQSAEALAAALVEVLLDRENEKMAAALASRYERARSYVEAIRVVEKMERAVRRWTPGLLNRLKSAGKSNSNVRDSFKANEVAQRILATHAPPPASHDDEVPF